MSIVIDTEHWPMAAGCIGLAKLYQAEIQYTPSGIILEEQYFEDLAERYINSLIEQFSIAEREYNNLQWNIRQARRDLTKIKEVASDVRKKMNDQIKKVKKYYPDSKEYERLASIIEEIKSIKNKDDLMHLIQLIEDYYSLLKTPFINERLTLNYVKAVILNPFFGQTSILQPSFNNKSKNDHIERINIDFIEPAQIELGLYLLLKKGDLQKIKQFVSHHQSYKPFKSFIKELNKIETNDQLKAVLEQNYLPCSFIDKCIATQTFQEMIFSPLSFSRDKAINFYWNFDKTNPIPISAITRVIMFLAPYGMAFYTRRYGGEYAWESLRFAGLIESNKHFEEIVKENILYQEKRSGGSSFEEAIVGLLQETVDKAKKITEPSYYFLEVFSEYQTKKTLLDYYHMPNYLVKYLSRKGNKLKFITDNSIRDEYFRAILNGIDPRETLYKYLRLSINNPFHAKGVQFASVARQEILLMKKGVNEMSNKEKLTWAIYYHGLHLKNKMLGRHQDENSEVYRASGNKKIEGIAYRLLNTAKAKNRQAFMDIIFRTHIAHDLEIPSFFVSDNIDFDTVATSFLAGLLAENKGEESNE